MKKDYQLYTGDCLEILKSFPDESFDMIFADPPYMVSSGGTSCQNGKLVSINKGVWDKSKGLEQDFEFHKNWLRQIKRLLKPNGTIWVSGTYHSSYFCGVAMQFLGYHILNEIAWFKNNAAPNLSCKYFTASHETLIWARKNKRSKHYFNYPAMKNGDFPKDFIKKPDLQMRTVWAISTTPPDEKKFGKHPTQKPMLLLDRIIEASTKQGDTILDPFMGSGTTGVSAVSKGRKFIGIDTSAEYVEIARKRIENA